MREEISESGHFTGQTNLSHALVVGLGRGGVRPFLAGARLAVVVGAASLWEADGFVAGIRAVQDGLLRLLRLGVDVSHGGVEVTGGRDQAFDLRDAAVVVLFLFLLHGLVTVGFVDGRVQRRLRGTAQVYRNLNEERGAANAPLAYGSVSRHF